MQPRRSLTLTQRAVMELREMVLNGTLAPGERLYEIPLAERLSISRTPLRGALAELEREGLIERAGAGGYAVRSFTLADIADAIELRGVLEGTAARLAAERGPDPAGMRRFLRVLEALDRTLEPDPERMDFEGYVSLNAEFHAILAGLAGSEVIRAEVMRASRLPVASASAFLEGQREVLAFRRSLVGAQAQHRALCEAIAAREGTRAEAIAREHARLARHNLDHVMRGERNLIRRVPGLALVAERPAPEAGGLPRAIAIGHPRPKNFEEKSE